MQISTSRILSKIEDLLQKAKSSQTEDGAERYIVAIHSLCELMLEDKNHSVPSSIMTQPAAQQAFANIGTQKSASQSYPQAPPAKIEGANGNSLLDF